MSLRVESDGSAVRIWMKALPGASRDQIAGVLGDRLKVRISAPAEGGKANDAIRRVIARALGVKPSAVTIESGHTNPEKIVRIDPANAADIRQRLAKPAESPK